MRRDFEELADELDMSRRFRNEIASLFDESLSMQSLWDEMEQLMDEFSSPPSHRRRMSRLFGQGGGQGGRGLYAPAIDLVERDDEYLLKVDLPGMREQDVQLNVDEDNVLTVSGERREQEETSRGQRGFAYGERMHGKFCRSIALPRGIETSKIESDFRNGVLEVRIPRGEASRPRHIPIGRGAQAARQEEPRVLDQGGNGPGRGGESRENRSQGQSGGR